MKVKQLIEQLERMDPEQEVHICYQYGDYWRTQVAPPACYVSEGNVTFSAYHSMDALSKDPKDDDEEEDRDADKFRDVVLISNERIEG